MGGGNSVFLNMYFDNVYAVYEKATDGGATVVMPPSDVVWGKLQLKKRI